MANIIDRYGRKVLQITKDDLDDENFYVGNVDVTDQFDGHIEIAADLGWVRFRTTISARYSLIAEAGSGIEAGTGIKAGTGIEAGTGIKAGTGIEAGWGIKAGTGIEAGTGIKAGTGIEAGWGIKAGTGIEAGLSIVAKWISSPLRIFAGLCIWRRPKPEEMQIRAEVRSGEVAFGSVVEPDEPHHVEAAE